MLEQWQLLENAWPCFVSVRRWFHRLTMPGQLVKIAIRYIKFDKERRLVGFATSTNTNETEDHCREMFILMLIVALLILCSMCMLRHWAAEQRANVIRSRTSRLMLEMVRTPHES